ILVRHFSTKGIEDYVRITIGTKKQMNELFDAKIVEQLDFGKLISGLPCKLSKVSSSIRVQADTKFGPRIIKLQYQGMQSGVQSSSEAYIGTFTWEIENPYGVPEAYRSGSVQGLSVGADYQQFGDSLYAVAEQAIQDFYNESVGGTIDEVAGYVFSNVTQQLINKHVGSFSNGLFSLLTTCSKHQVSCPVDVYIYDMDGNLCGSIIDNQVVVQDQGLCLYVDGDDKYFWCSGDDYRVKLVGTGVGTMDYVITEYGGTEILREVTFQDVLLTTQRSYEEDIPTDTLNAAEKYILTEAEGEVVPADLDSYTPPAFCHLNSATLSDYPDAPATLSAVISCTESFEGKNALLMAAFYSETGKLVSSMQEQILLQDELEITLESSVDSFDACKVFLLGAETLTPLCQDVQFDALEQDEPI
ncbi:MAG: hypothetical protein ACI4PD_03805, partial [Butyricicoccus sp.]